MRSTRSDRRKGADLLQRSFLWLALISWGLFLLGLLAYDYARPEGDYGLLRYWQIDIRTYWDPKTLPLFLYALWGCCGVTLVSILLNFSRNRRYEDFHIFNFVLLLVITIASLAVYYLGLYIK